MSISVQLLGQDTTIEASEHVFDAPYREDIIHQVTTAYMAGGRAGTVAQKTRSEVSGGGIKPWRQKGTGRARAGSIRSPLWRKGGKIFAAKPRDYSQKVNRRIYRFALRSILSQLLRENRLTVVEQIDLADHKTKTMSAWLNANNLNRVFIIDAELSENLILGSRNLSNVWISDEISIDPVSLVAAEKVVLTKEALKALEERLV
jgi:large subunit ribosomal protein L4